MYKILHRQQEIQLQKVQMNLRKGLVMSEKVHRNLWHPWLRRLLGGLVSGEV